jgi:outer membrane protein TolC
MKRRLQIETCALGALVLSFLAGAPAAAQDASAGQPGSPPVTRLTLAEAIDRGLAASHRVGEATAHEAANKAAVQSRASAEWPQVSLLAGYMRTNHVTEFGLAVPGGPFRVIYPDIPDNYRTRLDLQWPIYTSGRVQATVRAARAEADASGRDVEAARADLRLEITRSYWALATANESVRVVDESLKMMDDHLRDVRNRQQVGLVPPSDVLSVEAQRSRQEVLLIEAQNQRDAAAADLGRLVGAAPDTPIDVNGTLADIPAVPPSAADLVADARKTRPERQGLTIRVTGAAERQAAARASSRPVIAVAGGFDYARPNPRIFPRSRDWNDSWDAGVNFSWLLWDGGRTRADVAEAAANKHALEERLQEFDSVLEVEIRQRRLDLESARAAIRAAGDAVRSAAEARRVVADRYAAGVATNTEVVDAQVLLLQAELDRTRALANAQLAAARLQRALGH